MHEFSIAQSLTSMIEAEAGKREAVAVHRVVLEVGELSGVEVDLLRTAFEAFRDRPLWAATELEIEVVPASWSCPTCKELFAAGARLQCPDCRQPAHLTQGGEIVLQRIEMEAA